MPIQRYFSSELATRLALVLAVLAGACSREDPAQTDPPAIAPETPSAPSRAIVLGDVEADEPVLRIRRIKPLADFLGRRLSDLGIEGGRVVVARDLAEMSRFLTEARVDLYLDSPLQILAVQKSAGSRILLRRWARGDPEYWSVFVTRKESGLASLADLKGRIIAFQEPDSTSGYLLPGSTLLERGFRLRNVTGLSSRVDPEEIGGFFSGDEENALELVLSGLAEVAVLSNQDFSEIPADLRDQLAVIDRTAAVPRQLIPARSDLDPDLARRVEGLLLGLTDMDRQEMSAGQEGRSWTWMFDELPEEDRVRLEKFAGSIEDLSGN